MPGTRGLVRAVLGAVLVVGSLTGVVLVSEGSAVAAPPTTITLYVAPAGTASTGCTSSTNACETIQEGVTAAELLTTDAVTITVAAGAYTGGITVSAGTLSSLTITGAGASSTTVSGGAVEEDFTVSTGNVTLRDLAIETGSNGVSVGTGSTVTMTDDTFWKDEGFYGGGVFNDGNAIMTDDTFSTDSATGEVSGPNGGGGGVANYTTSTATMTDDTFSKDKGHLGGGIRNFTTSTATMTDDTFSTDSATYGGGIFSRSSTITLTHVTLTKDTAHEYGGGVFNTRDDRAVLDHVALSTDTAYVEGGGIANSTGSTAKLTDVTFSADSARYGGGFYNDDSTATMTNITLANDSATYGGGVANMATGNSAATVTMTDDTFSGDTAGSAGGAVFNVATTATATVTATMTASIAGSSSCVNEGTASGTYDVVTTATCNFRSTGDETVTASELGLATHLAANGSTGPQTLAIGPTSAAFELVPKAACTVTTDERGDPRPGFAGENCDAGAYEYQRPPAPVVTSVTVPGAPTLTSAMPSTGSVELAWTAPATTGGSAITGYEVCYSATTSGVAACSTHETTAAVTSATVTGLTNGTTYSFAVKAENAKGYGPLSKSKTATPAPPTAVTRVAGATADGTAAAELTRAYPSTKDSCPASRAVVLATTQTYDDALSSQFLAGSLTTGTLLTPTERLSSVTAAALKEEGIKTVYVVGGPLAITTTVVKAIEALTAYGCGGTIPTGGKITVTRIFGETQYGTAEAIADHVGTAASKAFPGAYASTNATGGTGRYNDTKSTGTAAPTGSVPTAILASGEEFQDAQAASVVAYRTKLPLLLTPATSLSTTAAAAITKLGVQQVVLMGGTLVVSNSVEAALTKAGVSVLRLAGTTSTDTADELARFEVAGATAGLSWTPGHRVLVARGNGFTDGIAGAVLDSPHNTATGPASTARPLLLTESPTTLGAPLVSFSRTTGHTGIGKTPSKTITSLTVLGGPLAVSTDVVTQMETDLAH